MEPPSDLPRGRQVVFIASHLFSGSTLLSYVLGSHPQAATLGEHHRRFEGERTAYCSYCRNLGRPSCVILHGVNQAPLAEAYRLPLRRFAPGGVTTLIDNSKQIAWLRRLIEAEATVDLPTRVIQLIRDPRGWLASALSRNASGCPEELLGHWLHQASEQQRALEQLTLPVFDLNYDLFTLDPLPCLERLSSFIGLDYGQEQLAYWQYEHHGMGANGAAINVLPDQRGVSPDRPFYLSRLQQPFHDDRWRRRPEAASIDAMVRRPRIEALLAASGSSFDRIDRLWASQGAAPG